MSAVESAIRRAGNRALIGYLPVGYPDTSTSVEAVVALAEAGCTAIELGVPYSDPAIDGPVVQSATQVTLERGFRIDELFEVLEAITKRVSVPVIVMSYWNPVLRVGVDRFAARLARAGGAGLITPDLTPENAEGWIQAAEANDLDRVFLAAPSSSDERIDSVIKASRGFVYTVSTMGTTGTRVDVDTAARDLSERIAHRAAALGREDGVLRCVGLGISNASHVRGVLEYADGAIVGSAILAALGEGGVPAVRELTSSLVRGTAIPAATIEGDAARPANTAVQKGQNA